MPENKSKPFSVIRGIKGIVGIGIYLLLLGLFIEGITLVIQHRISFPITTNIEMQIILTIPCVTACVLGMIWFNRSLSLIKVNLLNGKNELITHGPFAYVRHPLYSILMITIPPLFIIWFADLLFFIPWIVIILASHFMVRIEEKGLIDNFGEAYEKYRRYVPALIPYRGAPGKYL